MPAATASRGDSDPTTGTTQANMASTPLATTAIPEETRPTSEEGPRPALARNWQTERPQATTRSSILPARLARIGTNTSALNAAILSGGHDQDHDSSSSSSSSDED